MSKKYEHEKCKNTCNAQIKICETFLLIMSLSDRNSKEYTSIGFMNLFLKLKNSKRLMHYKSLFIEYLNFLNDIVYFLPLIFLKDSRKINLVNMKNFNKIKQNQTI